MSGFETVRFRELTLQAFKNLPCPGCGKKVRRQRVFAQTLNPYNRNADGQPKTSTEIYPELRAEAAAWETVPVTCKTCKDGAA